MKALLKKMKLNNKGDTLAIVLIGILILGVLGTVIMGSSNVNFGMKVSNLKNKQNFYYVERAIDDIYAGIGKEVSKAMQGAYDESIKNVVVSEASGISGYGKNSSLKDQFVASYKNKLNSGSLEYLGSKENIKTQLMGFIDSSYYNALGVNITIEVKDTPVISLAGVDPWLTIKNVKVTSKSKSYESSVTTDFVIKIPNIDFNFVDTPVDESNLDELFKYAIIADGQVNKDLNSAGENKEMGAIHVNRDTVIDGNVYAGGDYHEYLNAADINSWRDKYGIFVDAGAELTINAANVISKGAIMLGEPGASASNPVININPKNPSSPSESLRLWANDIILSANQSEAQINGDCFVKDDLEVNGNECNVGISGSYYGFGFDADSRTGSEKNSGDMAEFEAQGAGTQEHEKRSAVIVNGREADVKLTGDDKQCVIGGRAYIDLSNSNGVGTQTKAADYMTGESISIKGNQKIYLLDNPADYQNKNPNIVPSTIIKGNPVSLQDLGLTGGYTTDQFYNLLNLDDKQVVAKKVGNSIYFYERQNNPQLQTDYVVDSVKNTTKSYWEILNDAVANMGIKNLCMGNNTKSYTVGTAMQVVNGTMTTGRGGTLSRGANGIEEEDSDSIDFKNIISDVSRRYDGIMRDLQDDRNLDKSGNIEHPIGSDKTEYSTATSNSPYDYFVDTTMYDEIPVGAGRNLCTIAPFGHTSSDGKANTTDQCYYPDTSTNPTASGKNYKLLSISTEELKQVGVPEGAKVELTICNNMPKSSIGSFQTGNNPDNPPDSNTVYGVIICSGDLTLNCNFNGMIICGGHITTNDSYKITANPELMKLLCKKSEFLSAVLKNSKSTTITPPTGNIIGSNKYSFDKFVKIENWKKNAD